MLETLDYIIRIGSTPTFLYFDLYLYSAYAAHYVYFNLVHAGQLNLVNADRLNSLFVFSSTLFVVASQRLKLVHADYISTLFKLASLLSLNRP